MNVLALSSVLLGWRFSLDTAHYFHFPLEGLELEKGNPENIAQNFPLTNIRTLCVCLKTQDFALHPRRERKRRAHSSRHRDLPSSGRVKKTVHRRESEQKESKHCKGKPQAEEQEVIPTLASVHTKDFQIEIEITSTKCESIHSNLQELWIRHCGTHLKNCQLPEPMLALTKHLVCLQLYEQVCHTVQYHSHK